MRQATDLKELRRLQPIVFLLHVLRLLGVVGLSEQSKIYLKVRPYVHRPKEGKPPWCGDFTHGSL